jgi:excisionase family DNA binding protein
VNDTRGSVEFLTLPAAARRIGVGAEQIRRAVREGELSAYAIGGWRRLRWTEVLAWLEGRRVRATPHARARVAELLAQEAARARGHGEGARRGA